MSVSSDECNVHPQHNSQRLNISNVSPFYSTNINDRFVYNVQLQHNGFRKQRNRHIKKSTNCFVKAFQWYTQDHAPRPKTYSRNVNTDVSAFAAWLDTKYDEFLNESPVDSNVCTSSFKVIHTSMVIDEKFRNDRNICATYNSHKKEWRLRSPWRKRRRAANKEVSELREFSYKSCEFIMQPKNLPWPTSECCVTNKNCSHKDSKTSTNSQITELTVIKSQAQVLSQGDNNVKKCDTILLRTSKTNLKTNTSKQLLSQLCMHHTVECQCPEKMIVKKDENTQYDILNEAAAPVQSQQVSVENALKCVCLQREPERFELKKTCTTSLCTGTIVIRCDKACQYESDTESIPCRMFYNTCYDCKMSKESKNQQQDGLAIATTSNFSKIHKQIELKQKEICFAHGTMQTSDHSIRLEHQYPMFMKIICADKLNEQDC